MFKCKATGKYMHIQIMSNRYNYDDNNEKGAIQIVIVSKTDIKKE